MLTLHPQSAMEHLHHRFVAAEGSGSDGAIAFEATEVSSTSRARTLVPVRPAEPLAGAPDRSPIPLADNVQAAGVAVSAAAGNAKTRGGRGARAGRRPGPGRHAPPQAGLPAGHAARLAARDAAAGRPRDPRAGHRRRRPRPRRLRVRRQRAAAGDQLGQRRAEGARPGARRPGQGHAAPGIDLDHRRPGPGAQAADRTPTSSSRSRPAPGSSATVLAPLQAQAVAGLDRLYGVVPVKLDAAHRVQAGRRGRAGRPRRAWSAGPTACPYVIDRSTKSVYPLQPQDQDGRSHRAQRPEEQGGHGRRPRATSRSAARTC